MNDDSVFQEVVSSKKTSLVFLIFMVLFLMVLICRVVAVNFDGLAIVYLVLLLVFLFYTLNYQTLSICLRRDCLQLKFGLFH